MKQYEKEFEYELDNGHKIVGEAVFEYETEQCLDSDTGGADGVELSSCNLSYVRVGFMKLGLNSISDFMGYAVTAFYEGKAAMEIQELLDAGDLS